MRILALDPGPEATAWVLWEPTTKIVDSDIQPNELVLASLGFNALSGTNDLVAIEMVAHYGMPVGREVFETCVWIGRFMERSPRKPQLIYRRDVKLHHCQSPRAKDSNIRQVLIDKYGQPGTKKAPGLTYGLKSHLWAAFAIATYVSETMNERAAARKLLHGRAKRERRCVDEC